MEILIRTDSAAVGATAANYFAHLIRNKPDCVLGLATGSTPIPMYRDLISMHENDGLNFSGVRSFNLDEYVGLGPGDENSYWTFMHEHLFDHVNIDEDNVHVPDGLAEDSNEACRSYEADINLAGGIDLQVLGVGTDGHIGFNEPTSSLASRTRIKSLLERTRQDNARFFSSLDAVPHHVITMGIGTVMESKCVMLLATGDNKADAIAASIEGPITAMVPATALQDHPYAILVIDEAAASELKLHDYYVEVEHNKPRWQVIDR